MTIRFVCAWYDFWIGAYWDRSRRALYLMPLPMLGIRIQFASRSEVHCNQYKLLRRSDNPSDGEADCVGDGHYECIRCYHLNRNEEPEDES